MKEILWHEHEEKNTHMCDVDGGTCGEGRWITHSWMKNKHSKDEEKKFKTKRNHNNDFFS